ncbi:MAG: hypothetical protein RR353_04955 [Victivallaceae bacterium]
MEKIRADYKRLHEILDNGKDIDQVQNLSELKNIIFGAKTREESLIEKCFSLQEEVIRLKSEIGQKKTLKFTKNVFQDEQENYYCPACYQAKDPRAVFLISDDPNEYEHWSCPICKDVFTSREAQMRKQEKIEQSIVTRQF